MIEDAFEQVLYYYQQAIEQTMISADPRSDWQDEALELTTRFNALAHMDRSQFRRLCARLLTDERREIRWGTLKLLRTCDIKDHVLSVALAQMALKYEDLREEALYTLLRIGTRRVLPQLFSFVQQGYAPALYLIRHLLQTPEEIEQGIALARTYLLAGDYELREAALFLLQKYSSMDQEAERVLAAVQRYSDELFIDALKRAPAEVVLEPLKALRASIQSHSAEYEDLSATITALERKRSTL